MHCPQLHWSFFGRFSIEIPETETYLALHEGAMEDLGDACAHQGTAIWIAFITKSVSCKH